jgi:hypothetical protein
VVTAEQLDARKLVIADSPDLRALLAHLETTARPVIERMPVIPERKAFLSSDGGICPDDGAALTFDPWSPSEHRCPRCGKTWRGERHDGHWARFQHLWIAERAVHLATLAAFDESRAGPAAARAREVLMAYAERYWRYPNRDNVLGPSRLFFSTYLESLWVCNYVAAATLLRETGRLDDAGIKAVNQVTEEAVTIIGDFDEGFSNRQTWNNAALAAVAAWFQDDDLAQRAVESETGLIGHLVRGYGRDGMWFEGENYHLFALRGWMTGMMWARLAGVEVTDPRLATRLSAALRAPTLSALPDFTFPARKDSRFGLSLAHPSFLELWEIGLAWLANEEGEVGDDLREITAWLHRLYENPAKPDQLLESYLHDTPMDRITHPISRGTLSWWALLELLPSLPPDEPWNPPSTLFESQGLAVLRSGDRYVSLECGPYGGGHGHPDRLHLTLHAGGVHWLADPGAGSYVSRDLFWYRSTLAHNAPRLDGVSQTPGSASCECFDDQEGWAWMRGRFGPLIRTVVRGPDYFIDVMELSGRDERLVGLPWHFAGKGDVQTKGRWVNEELTEEFVTRVERFIPDAAGPRIVSHTATGGGARLTAHFVFDGELLRAEGPGLPWQGQRATFYLIRGRGRNVRFVTVLEIGDPTIRDVRVSGDNIEIERAGSVDRHRTSAAEWIAEPHAAEPVVLRGVREQEAPFQPLLRLDPPVPVVAPAFRIGPPSPPLDGTWDQFELSDPIQLSLEDQYRRSEDGYPGPEDLSAIAYLGWDETALYVGVEVTKPEVCFRPADAPALRLDNEPDDIHSDGLQVYIADGQSERGGQVGYLIVPEPGSGRVRARPTSDTPGDAAPQAVRGGWRRTETGYRMTVGIPWPTGFPPHAGARVRFDLIVNEMLPGRLRRAGQLVWSGGGGWVWLRGDRQDPARFGILELVG